MINFIYRNIWRFIIVLLIQVFVLNNIDLGQYINPYFYVIFILLLPFETPRWILLISGFALGITLDLFAQTPGMHAAATVFIAYMRPYVLSLIAPRENYELGTLPRVYYYGMVWFFKYTIILVILHHIFLFYVEAFTFQDFLHTLSRALLSSIFTAVLIVFSQFFIFRR